MSTDKSKASVPKPERRTQPQGGAPPESLGNELRKKFDAEAKIKPLEERSAVLK